MKDLRVALSRAGWMEDDGAYAIVDGQFGSTGKGLAAGMVAECLASQIDVVTTNAGPNSGHTSYYGDEKIVLRQLPTAGVIAWKMGHRPHIVLNAGAIIDPEVFWDEASKYASAYPLNRLMVHPNAAVVTPEAKEAEMSLTGAIGSTGKGTGGALAAKVMRSHVAVASGDDSFLAADLYYGPRVAPARILMEVSQGFSLGINQRFYPYCTSRECTVGQALSDAGIHPYELKSTMMVVRTFPIRVGGNSGDCYGDQRELSWEELGVEPERTTVTNKVRRVFTWSDIQFVDALLANRPEVLFVNFCNYFRDEQELEDFLQWIVDLYIGVMDSPPEAIFLGYGPRITDIRVR